MNLTVVGQGALAINASVTTMPEDGREPPTFAIYTDVGHDAIPRIYAGIEEISFMAELATADQIAPEIKLRGSAGRTEPIGSEPLSATLAVVVTKTLSRDYLHPTPVAGP